MKAHGGWYWPDCDDFMWREMRDGTYQADHLEEALTFVTDFRCAVDAGAHVGVWTKELAIRFDRVIAVEPAEDTYACLVENLWGFRIQNVDPMHMAVGAQDGYVAMALDAKQAERKNTGGRYVVRRGNGVLDIPCVTIDSWNLPALGFLKLDVEGSEPDAIKGAARTIARCQPVVLFEDKGFGVRFGYERNASQELLKLLDYEHKVRVGHDEIWGPRS